jgi:hypothetical protein
VTEPPIGRFLPSLRFRRTRIQKEKKLVVAMMLTFKVIYPFMGYVNSRVSLSCSVDRNGKTPEAVETDARIDKGETR